jgi:hypothetical protein
MFVVKTFPTSELLDDLIGFFPSNHRQQIDSYIHSPRVNAPVNYFPLAPIFKSVCIGIDILEFKVEYKDSGPIVTSKLHKAVVEKPRGDEYRRMYMFVMSLVITYVALIRVRRERDSQPRKPDAQQHSSLT